MKALAWTAPGVVSLLDAPEPVPTAGEVLLRPAYTGICGTDHSVVMGAHSRATAPVILGHEWSAVVVQAPAGTGLDAGDPVAVEPVISCGACPECRAGTTNLCRSMGLLGIDHDGSLAELCVAPVERVRRLPSHRLLAAAALAEPTAVAVRALRRAGELSEGSRLFIGGAGPIGLLAALVARTQGVEAVLSDPAPARRELAGEFGFASIDPTADPLPERFDAAIEAAGSPAALSTCCAVVRPGAVVVLVGLSNQAIPLTASALIGTETAVVGSRIYTGEDFDTALALLVEGALDVDRLITRRATFDEAAREGVIALGSDPRSIKVLIEGVP